MPPKKIPDHEYRELAHGLPVERLEEFRKAYEAGNRIALFHAISTCLAHEVRAPKWVYDAFHVAVFGWALAEFRTLDQAFGVTRPKGWSQKRARKDAMGFWIWSRVNDYRRENRGTKITRDLFVAVAEKINAVNGDRFHVNATDVQAAYYRVEKIESARRNPEKREKT